MPETPSAAADIWFEDYLPGRVFDLGMISVSQEAIVSFAREYDPQPFHLDPVAAAEGPFGGLVASGWQTVGLMMRLFATKFLGVSSLGSPGIDELRWPHPVRPGDVLDVKVEVLEARLSNSKLDRGIVRSRVVVVNQNGAAVLTLLVVNLMFRRPTGPPVGLIP